MSIMWLVDLYYTEMAKLILLLVFVCFQFSKQEELTQINLPNDEPLTKEIPLPLEKNPADEMLDGEDENQWYRGEPKDTESEDDWTEEDEKWFQEIQETLAKDDDDYDDDFEAIEKLIDDIENWMEKANPEKSKYEWLFDIEKWFNDDIYDDDDYAEYPDLKEENLSAKVDVDKDLVYSWLYKLKVKNSKTKRAQPLKRFWSV